MFFLKHLQEFTEQRKDFERIEVYHKMGFFEELCHLVEHKGDSSTQPESYWALWRLYGLLGKQSLGNSIIEKLGQTRNHYEVYRMMINAYPEGWIERYGRFFTEPAAYETEYEQWQRDLPFEIALARLVTDYLQTLSVLYVAGGVSMHELSKKHRELLDGMIKKGELDIEKKKLLIGRDMGPAALNAVVGFDQSKFETRDTFFSSVLELWKRLRLV